MWAQVGNGWCGVVPVAVVPGELCLVAAPGACGQQPWCPEHDTHGRMKCRQGTKKGFVPNGVHERQLEGRHQGMGGCISSCGCPVTQFGCVGQLNALVTSISQTATCAGLYKCNSMLLAHMVCSIMQPPQASDLHPINRIMLTCKHEHTEPLKQTLQGKTVEQYRYTHDVRVA